MQFSDRYEAGRMLAPLLGQFTDRGDVIVLALPCDGVPVGFEVAQALNLELDIFLAHRVGVPGLEQVTLGTVASGGCRVINREIASLIGMSPEEIERAFQLEADRLEHRQAQYRSHGRLPEVQNRTVILVDDGLGIGTHSRAAITALKTLGPARIVMAAPVAAAPVCAAFERDLDVGCVSVARPERYFGVSTWYRNFGQTTDVAVWRLLREANAPVRFRVA